MKRGRKPLKVSQRRTMQIGIYVTKLEHRQIRQLIGEETVSDYGRKLLLKQVKDRHDKY